MLGEATIWMLRRGCKLEIVLAGKGFAATVFDQDEEVRTYGEGIASTLGDLEESIRDHLSYRAEACDENAVEEKRQAKHYRKLAKRFPSNSE